MIKMYNAEVLSKFPVVQHFPFGSLFQWEHDPSTSPVKQSVHTANQPPQKRESNSNTSQFAKSEPLGATKAPWASSGGATSASGTRFPAQAPHLRNVEQPISRASRTIPSSSNNILAPTGVTAPRAHKAAEQDQRNPTALTRAPWADK